MKGSKTKNEACSTDLKPIVEKLTFLIDSWTEETFRAFPHLMLLLTHRTLFTTHVLKMLLIAVIQQLDKLVLQVLNNDTPAVLEKVVQLIVGLTVKFTLKAVDAGLMLSQLKRLEAIFEASYSRLQRDTELELCCPLVKFVPAAMALNANDFLLVNVEVVLPAQLNLKLHLPEYGNDKMAAFKDFVSKNSNPYPVLDFLTAVDAGVQVHRLSDKYGLESAVLDPYRQYLTLGGITYVTPHYEPSAMMLYFTAHCHQRILSCSYHPTLKTFFFHISDSALPGEGGKIGKSKQNSEAESSVDEQEWSIASIIRLRIVSSTSPLILAPELMAESYSSMIY